MGARCRLIEEDLSGLKLEYMGLLDQDFACKWQRLGWQFMGTWPICSGAWETKDPYIFLEEFNEQIRKHLPPRICVWVVGVWDDASLVGVMSWELSADETDDDPCRSIWRRIEPFEYKPEDEHGNESVA